MIDVHGSGITPKRLREISRELEGLAEDITNARRSSYPSEVTADRIRRLSKARALRTQYLGRDLFADATWDILLDLFAARLENRDVSITSLCIASGVPATTALRHIAKLEERGIIFRERAPVDGRRIYMRLDEEFGAKMQVYLAVCLSRNGHAHLNKCTELGA